MKGKMIVLKTDGVIETVDITGCPAVETLQELVGGWLELVPKFHRYDNTPCVAFCDEEGGPQLKNLPVNKAATDWWRLNGVNETLRGNVVVIAGDNELLASL